MADQQPQRNLFSTLKRLFSTDVIIRNDGGTLKTVDVNQIQVDGVLQTNALVDRFNRIYTTSTSYGVNLNLSQNYQSARVQIYSDYEAMDTDPIIASALDIIADECTLKNSQGDVIQIRSSDENIQKILYSLFYDVLNVEFNLWFWIRNMCKYGDFFLKLEVAEKYGVYNVIPFSAYNIVRLEGTNPSNPSEVIFKYDPTAALGATAGYSTSYQNTDLGITFYNYEMAHLRLIGDVNYLPYGRSYLEPGRRLYKQYILMEDAMMIHRLTRAPQRRIFYVNVGAIPPNEVENYMQRMINKMKKTPLVDQKTGQYNLNYNVQNMLEDFFIPVRGNDSSTRIDNAPPLEYNGIEDINYLLNKLFAALKIPKAFLGYEKDLTGKATLAAEDIRFARTIERIQRIVISELTKIALVHLYAHGYDDESLTNFELSLTTPSIIYEQERIALMKEKTDLAAQMIEIGLMPTDWIYDKLFHFSEEEFDEYRDLIMEDKKRKFRMTQIEEEGNDPAESGQAYGTPHQIASMYGGYGSAPLSGENVPQGYDETNPSEPVKLPGRPANKVSLINTSDDPLGRDRMGVYDLKSKPNSGEDAGGLRSKFTGGSPLSLRENKHTTVASYLTNKAALESYKKNKRVNIYENDKTSELLDESRIRPDSDLI
jgi:Bacteriophage T4-like portal protein (Gp20)